jgi:hypothetical protein
MVDIAVPHNTHSVLVVCYGAVVSVRGSMRRREFIALLGGATAWPLTVHAQLPKGVARVGFIATGSLKSPETLVILNYFQQGLRELGYVEGTNIVIEYRGADSKIERFPDLAAELVRRVQHARGPRGTASDQHHTHCCAGYGRSFGRWARCPPGAT